jgi:predicted nucleic acid-binding protein
MTAIYTKKDLMFQIFVDTSVWYALLDKTDSLHDNAVEFFQSLAHPVVTTNYIVDETVTLAKNRLGHRVAVEIGEKLWNEEAATLIYVTTSDEKKAWEIFVSH